MPPNAMQVFILFLPLGKYPKFQTELVHHPPLLHVYNDFLQLKFEQIQDIKNICIAPKSNAKIIGRRERERATMRNQ